VPAELDRLPVAVAAVEERVGVEGARSLEAVVSFSRVAAEAAE
jgi:hypothetical protein